MNHMSRMYNVPDDSYSLNMSINPFPPLGNSEKAIFDVSRMCPPPGMQSNNNRWGPGPGIRNSKFMDFTNRFMATRPQIPNGPPSFNDVRNNFQSPFLSPYVKNHHVNQTESLFYAPQTPFRGPFNTVRNQRSGQAFYPTYQQPVSGPPLPPQYYGNLRRPERQQPQQQRALVEEVRGCGMIGNLQGVLQKESILNDDVLRDVSTVSRNCKEWADKMKASSKSLKKVADRIEEKRKMALQDLTDMQRGGKPTRIYQLIDDALTKVERHKHKSSPKDKKSEKGLK